jgi:hypothetical protein
MADDAITNAEGYLAAGKLGQAIWALHSLEQNAERDDYEALARLANDIRVRTSKGRERVQCDGLIAHAEKSIRLIDHPEERFTVAHAEPFPSGLAGLDFQRCAWLGSN